MAYIPHSTLEGQNSNQKLEFPCGMVAKAMLSAGARADNFAMAAVDAAAEMHLLRCIGDMVGDGKLPLLRFAFVGSADQESEARAIVEGWGSSFYFVLDPDRDQALLSCGPGTNPSERENEEELRDG